MSVRDYIIDHRDIEWPTVLGAWSLLLPEAFTVWIMNRFGDLFIVLNDGAVHMLDVGGGTLEKLAESRDDFASKLNEGDNANRWAHDPADRPPCRGGGDAAGGQCYSYKQPPVLGGGYTIDNIFVLPIPDHYGAYGSIHRQLKDLPDGTRIVIDKKWGKTGMSPLRDLEYRDAEQHARQLNGHNIVQFDGAAMWYTALKPQNDKWFIRRR